MFLEARFVVPIASTVVLGVDFLRVSYFELEGMFSIHCSCRLLQWLSDGMYAIRMPPNWALSPVVDPVTEVHCLVGSGIAADDPLLEPVSPGGGVYCRKRP